MKLKVFAILALLPAFLPGRSADGLAISRLSPVNTIVKVDVDERFLLLPVEDNVPDARVDVLLDGNLVKTLFVRLAANRVDFKVPFDLDPFRGKGSLALNVIIPDDRAYSRDATDNILWDELVPADTFDSTISEKYRPVFHHTPPYGWMNDPNGMFYKDGVWHLYYQHNPYGSKWQNMTWGHSSSSDLVNWEHHPLAIEPNGLGSVFSGSSVVDSRNSAGFGEDAIVALYTSAGASQVQSLAHSSDGGMSFDIYPGNPIVTTFGEARDPNMFRHPDTGRWNMLLAQALNHEMLIYSSDNLRDWTLESSFGKGYGCQDGVWECPDLFPLPVRGTGEQKWVLICNINPGGPNGGSAAQYFTGDFDGSTFVCDTLPDVTKWMDWGKDHYAAVSFSGAPEGRHTTMAWMSNWEYANEVPTIRFRGANTLPRDHDLFVGDDGDLYLGVFPAKEVEKMRGKHVSHKSTKINGTRRYELPTANDGVCEIDLGLIPEKARSVVLTLSNPEGEKVIMEFDIPAKTFAMDRSHSGNVGFSSHFVSRTVAPTHAVGDRLGLRLFVDKCSIEAFDADGRFAMTNLVFPSSPYTTLEISAPDAPVRLDTLTIYEIAR